MNFLAKIFTDDGGNPSSVRLVSAISSLAVVGTWAYTSIQTLTIQPLDLSAAAVALGSLGLKVLQKGKENEVS